MNRYGKFVLILSMCWFLIVMLRGSKSSMKLLKYDHGLNCQNVKQILETFFLVNKCKWATGKCAVHFLLSQCSCNRQIKQFKLFQDQQRINLFFFYVFFKELQKIFNRKNEFALGNLKLYRKNKKNKRNKNKIK